MKHKFKFYVLHRRLHGVLAQVMSLSSDFQNYVAVYLCLLLGIVDCCTTVLSSQLRRCNVTFSNHQQISRATHWNGDGLGSIPKEHFLVISKQGQFVTVLLNVKTVTYIEPLGPEITLTGFMGGTNGPVFSWAQIHPP